MEKEDVKFWLKSIGKDREWLAQKCGVSKRTVDNWISPGKPLPIKAQVDIQNLMDSGVASQRIRVNFNQREWEAILEVLKMHRESFLSFVNTALNNAYKDEFQEDDSRDDPS